MALGRSDVWPWTPRTVGPSWCHRGLVGPCFGVGVRFTQVSDQRTCKANGRTGMNEMNELRGNHGNFHEITDPSAILDGNGDGEIQF